MDTCRHTYTYTQMPLFHVPSDLSVPVSLGLCFPLIPCILTTPQKSPFRWHSLASPMTLLILIVICHSSQVQSSRCTQDTLSQVYDDLLSLYRRNHKSRDHVDRSQVRCLPYRVGWARFLSEPCHEWGTKGLKLGEITILGSDLSDLKKRRGNLKMLLFFLKMLFVIVFLKMSLSSYTNMWYLWC